MQAHDIFDPRDGITLYTVRSAILARLVIKLFARGRFWDYAPKGQGWV